MMIMWTVQVERLRIKDEEEEARTQLKLQAAKVTIVFLLKAQVSSRFRLK